MNDEQTTADATSDHRDGEQDRREERPSKESTSDSTREFGVTAEDMEQIRAFDQKHRHSRSVDDLRPSSKR